MTYLFFSVYCLDFDSSRIISGSRDRTIKVWCIKTGKCVASFEGHTGSVLCLKFERDWDLGSDGVCRGFMVSGSSDCTVRVWDLISTPVGSGERSGRLGKLRESCAVTPGGSFGPPRKISAKRRKVLRGHSGGVLDLRMDDKWIVSWYVLSENVGLTLFISEHSSKDALMHVYDRKSLTLHTVLRGHEGPVNAVGLENGRVVSASGDGKMMLWDVETGECIRVFEGHEKGLACIEFKARPPIYSHIARLLKWRCFRTALSSVDPTIARSSCGVPRPVNVYTRLPDTPYSSGHFALIQRRVTS